MKNFFRNTAEAVGLTFRKLVRIQFDAPWRIESVRRCTAGIPSRAERIGHLW